MDGNRIRCLQIVSQHVPIYLQQFPSYSNRKCKKKYPFWRTAVHIFVKLLWPLVSPRASITQYVAWMERLFDAYKLSRSMYLSIFNTFRVIRWLSKCVSPKITIFYHIFCFPPWGDALVVITSMWYGWKENWTPGWPPPYVYTCRARGVSDSYAYGRRMWHENII